MTQQNYTSGIISYNPARINCPSAGVKAAGTKEEQKQALLLLEAAVDRTGALEETWTGSEDFCTWSGVTCGDDGLVKEL